VVNNATKIWVEFKDGQNIKAKVEYLSIAADVASIRLIEKPVNPVIAKLGNSDSVEVGEQVFVIGTPLGLGHSFSSGYISGRHNQGRITSNMSESEFFQTDAAINQGNSGGPMFNLHGEVIGIASSIITQSGGFEGIGFAATINIAKTLLLEHKQMWYGFEPVILSDELAKIFNIPQEAGMLIVSVTKNSPAYFMGLRGGYLNVTIGERELLVGGDILLDLDGIPLISMENLEKIGDHMMTLKSGDKYKFKILRAGKIIEAEWVKD
jgi:S1-C subfamily serine protease